MFVDATATATATAVEDKSINSPTNNLFYTSSLERLKYIVAWNYCARKLEEQKESQKPRHNEK